MIMRAFWLSVKASMIGLWSFTLKGAYMSCNRKGRPVRVPDDTFCNVWILPRTPVSGAADVVNAPCHSVDTLLGTYPLSTASNLVTSYLTCGPTVAVHDAATPDTAVGWTATGDWVEFPAGTGRYHRVALVQRIAAGLPGEYQRVYLCRHKQSGF